LDALREGGGDGVSAAAEQVRVAVLRLRGAVDEAASLSGQLSAALRHRRLLAADRRRRRQLPALPADLRTAPTTPLMPPPGDVDSRSTTSDSRRAVDTSLLAAAPRDDAGLPTSVTSRLSALANRPHPGSERNAESTRGDVDSRSTTSVSRRTVETSISEKLRRRRATSIVARRRSVDRAVRVRGREEWARPLFNVLSETDCSSGDARSDRRRVQIDSAERRFVEEADRRIAAETAVESTAAVVSDIAYNPPRERLSSAARSTIDRPSISQLVNRAREATVFRCFARFIRKLHGIAGRWKNSSVAQQSGWHVCVALLTAAAVVSLAVVCYHADAEHCYAPPTNSWTSSAGLQFRHTSPPPV